MKRVFLGGTCNESTWRDELIPMLKIDHFNPVVPDWTPACQEEEIRQRLSCDFCLYVITPLMAGVYSIAEVVQDSCRKPVSTIFCVLNSDKNIDGNAFSFEGSGRKSLEAVMRMVHDNGSKVFETLEDVAEELNQHYEEVPLNENLIECLIERDGPTEIRLQKFVYRFEQNINGDYVCEVLNMAHRKHLLSLDDFRIYQEHLFPKPDFDEKEAKVVEMVSRFSDDRLRAYVNGHISELMGLSQKVKALIVEKWNRICGPQKCPIDDTPDFQIPAEPEKTSTTKNDDKDLTAGNDEAVEPVDYASLWNSIKRLSGENFKNWVENNDPIIMDSPDEFEDKAMAKWNRIVKDEPWPYEDDE